MAWEPHTTSKTDPTVQPWLGGPGHPLGTSTEGFNEFMAGAPGLLSQYENFPGLQVPGLDPTQQNLLQQFINAGQTSPDLAQARTQLQALTSGPIGSSPATQAGMQAFQQLEAPIIEQQSALRGTAGGGQAIEALGQGATQAALPLIQQEIQNRQQAVGQYSQIAQQQIGQLAMALEASGLPREVALEQAQALFQQQQGKTELATGLETYPLALWGPAGIGSRTVGTTNPGGAGYVGGIFQGLSPSGIFGSGGK